MLPSSFDSPTDLSRGRPVIFDILGPDKQVSLLPPELRIVLHVNPQSMQLNYSNSIQRAQTRGGYIENHWGKDLQSISFSNVTGGFMRLYAGLSNKTGTSGGGALQGNGLSESTAVQGRRETLAYDSWLDYLALFHHNGAIYDANGSIAQQGYIKITFDEGVYIGWFQGDLQLTESVERPFQFQFSSQFEVEEELLRFQSTIGSAPGGLFTDQQAPSTFFPPANFAGTFSEP